MPRNPDLPCADCGTFMWRSRTSLPAGEARCRSCRGLVPQSLKRVPAHGCALCGKSTNNPTYCSMRCANTATNRIRYGSAIHTGPNGHRSMRDAAAPGLRKGERSLLLAKWRKQGRTCAYCDQPAASVDHVVPLLRGGSNYEGNLAPACARCNSSKGALLLVEWRTARRCTVIQLFSPAPPRPPRMVRVVDVVLRTQQCELCHEAFTGRARKYCSTDCQVEHNARANRERYRERQGLPATWDRPRVAHAA